MTVPMPTEGELKKLAPKARAGYIKAFIAGSSHLREAGILDNPLRLCHFLAQTMAETDGWTILRESLDYKHVSRLREVWPGRLKKYSDDWIRDNLVGKPIAVGDLAYGGRMGNKKGTDGFNFRGGGYLQTTGRGAVEEYCTACGLKPDDDILDDIPSTLRFACAEWKSANCNKWADKNDLLAVSKIINVGSATSGVMPNGMSDRRMWFKKVWAVFGDERKTIPEATSITAKDLAAAGSSTVTTAQAVKGGATALATVAGVAQATQDAPVSPVKDVIEQVSTVSTQMDTVAMGIGSVKGFVTAATSELWIVVILFCVGAYFAARYIIQRRVSDARMGLNSSRVPDSTAT
jgi:putative chitinase